jgi:hypothetical protein
MLRVAFRTCFFFSKVNFSFVLRDGSLKEVIAEKGVHILQVAKDNDVEL